MMRPGVLLLARGLHPGAWWLWAIGLAASASRTHNPLLLALVLAVAAYVVTARRTDAPWSKAFVLFLKIGLAVVAIRTVAQVLLGVPAPGRVLVTLPSAELGGWAAGIQIGGAVTDASLLAAATDGLRLATVLACVGAANALANPKRLLASLPAALYEVGVAAVIALSFAPSLAASVQRIRAARRLRGRPDRGLRGMLTVAMPVLDDALQRSLALAAAMDSRGYGRAAPVSDAERRATTALLLGGLAGVAAGLYGLLDGSLATTTSVWMAGVGVAAASVGLGRAGHRTVRTRYRPDPWALPEWVTAGAGVAAVAGSLVTGAIDPTGLVPALTPVAALPLPVWATAGLLLALLPAWATPPPVPVASRGPRLRERTA